MRLAVAALWAIFLWTAGGSPARGADESDAVSLRAAAIEISRVPAVSFELMQRELEALVDGAELDLRWRRAGPSSETAPDELRVVFLDGPGRGIHADRGVLAASRPADPGPTIWVYTPTVVEALGRRPGEPVDSFAAQRELGIALGRVLAHELVHVLAPEVPHSHGLMSDRFRLVALDDTRPVLAPASADALARGARAWATRSHVGLGGLGHTSHAAP